MVEVYLEFPHFSGVGAEEWNAWYGKWRKGCEAYAEGVLMQRAQALYEREPPARRRFTHKRLCYRHTCRVICGDGRVSIYRKVLLRHKGSVLAEEQMGEVLDGRGRLCGPADLFPKKERQGLTIGNFILDAQGKGILLNDEGKHEKKQRAARKN